MESLSEGGYSNKAWREERVKRLVSLLHPNATDHYIHTEGQPPPSQRTRARRNFESSTSRYFYQVIVIGAHEGYSGQGRGVSFSNGFKQIIGSLPRYNGLPLKEFGSYVDGAIEALDDGDTRVYKCCVCSGPMHKGESHNAVPFSPEGERCCERCNMSFVIPARLGAAEPAWDVSDEAKK